MYLAKAFKNKCFKERHIKPNLARDIKGRIRILRFFYVFHHTGFKPVLGCYNPQNTFRIPLRIPQLEESTLVDPPILFYYFFSRISIPWPCNLAISHGAFYRR